MVFEASESRTTEIDAPIEVVYGVATEFRRYPEWATSLRRVVIHDGKVEERDESPEPPGEVEFFGGALGFSVRYRLRYDYDPPTKLTFDLVDGEIRGLLLKFSISSLDGSYEFESVGKKRTRAKYTLRVSLPMAPGPLRRKAAEIVMTTGLQDLKRRAESEAAEDTSGRAQGASE